MPQMGRDKTSKGAIGAIHTPRHTDNTRPSRSDYQHAKLGSIYGVLIKRDGSIFGEPLSATRMHLQIAGILLVAVTACASAQSVSLEQHLAEIERAYPCKRDISVKVDGPPATQARLRPYACSLTLQALRVIASGKGGRLGIPAADTASFRSAFVTEFVIPTFDSSGKPVPSSEEQYWAVTLLFGDPARSVEHDVYIGSRKTMLRRTAYPDTTRAPDAGR